MARFTLEEFEEPNPTLIYIAGNVVDAERAEQALQNIQMDYALNIEPFTTTSLFGRTRQGLFVYVSNNLATKGRQCLEANGISDTVDLTEFEEKGK